MLIGIGMENLSWSLQQGGGGGVSSTAGWKMSFYLGHTNSMTDEHSERNGRNTTRLLHITDPKYGLKLLTVFDKMLLHG